MNVSSDGENKEDIRDRIKVFDNYDQTIEIWAHPRIWELDNKDYYSEWFHQEINRLKAIIIEFVTDGYSNIVCEKYELDYFFLRNLVYWLAKYENILRAFFKTNGWQGRQGLEIACSKLRIFFFKNNRIPKTKDKGMIRIRNSLISGKNWIEFGINSWNDLLIYTFGEEEIRKWKETNEQKKFNKAIAELKKFKEETKRLPKYDDKKLKWIASSVSRGIWKKFGIDVWNDLMKHTFGEVNLEHNVYEGIEGFNKAKKELLDYHDKYKKLPTTNDFELIVRSIYRGVWQEYNINSWNDLLRKLFGKVNLDLQNDYTDELSLTRVKIELKSFEKSKGRLPKSNDDEMTSIANAIGRGMFKEQGIMTWNDLLYSTFGSINREINQYQGKEGLEKAVNKLKDFKKKYDKEPITGEMEVIYRTAKRREWKEFGIMTWNDLLNHAYGKNNREKNKYKGSEGLERAKQKLKKFKKRFGKIPTSVDRGISIIYNTIQKGEWKIFGIHTWNDLLRSVFGKIYYDKNKHLGKQGLEKAIQKCEDFKKKYNRLPKLRDEGMTSISSAITRGMWREFGINTWNDLLNRVFGEINKDINKYLGKKGLENAILVLKEFRKKYNKLPTSQSKGITSIYTAVKRCEWKEFGINSWNDLLFSVFEEIHFEINKYNGKKGLEKAIAEMKAFYKKNNKKPTSTTIGFNGIYKFIQKGGWKKFGIYSWNDLLKHVFGEIHIETNKYIEKKGLERAIKEIKEFESKHGKKPILKNKGMGGIVKAILRGEWQEYGINSWNDLLRMVFGEINKERNKYHGRIGLNKAINILKDFEKENGRKPASNSKGMHTIYNTARSGKWKEFGIYSWNDILKAAFGKINKERNKYIGKEGLERAMNELRKFREEFGKKPNSKSKGMNTIYTTARLGKWKEFGIKNWNDLLYKTFEKDDF